MSDDKRAVKKRDVLIILLFLLLALFFLWLFWNDLTQMINARDQQPVGTVIVKRNIAQRRYRDRVLWDRLRTESPVYLWNLIRVPENSAAIINIKNNSIALDENTLVRISLSPDGEIQIDLYGGSLSVISDENAESILLNLNGKIYKVTPGTVLSASSDENGSGLQYLLSANDVLEKEQFAISDSKIRLTSPAEDSIYRYYNDELPIVNFNWSDLEQASSYILEVSDKPDFSNVIIRNESENSTQTATLEEGEWYWRVRPMFPAIFNKTGEYSAVSNFSVIKSDITRTELESLSFSEWLAMEVPVAVSSESEPVPVPRPASAPRQQPAPQLPPRQLSVPSIISPVNNQSFGRNELQDRREIVFSWSPVQDAQNYIFTLYEQTPTGRKQIVRVSTNNATRYTFDNFKELNNGQYIWQVEATGNINGVERRVTTNEQIFILNVPLPTPVEPNEVQQVIKEQ